jgi:hypothetical protein
MMAGRYPAPTSAATSRACSAGISRASAAADSVPITTWPNRTSSFSILRPDKNGKLELFRRFSSEELKARLDGTVLDGHHRLSVLVERGEDIDALPREINRREP